LKFSVKLITIDKKRQDMLICSFRKRKNFYTQTIILFLWLSKKVLTIKTHHSMKKGLLFNLFLMLVLVSGLFAKDINRSQAEKVAVNFMYQKMNLYSHHINYQDLNIINAYKIQNAYYVINFEDGWVLVSADDAMVPVLGYNLKGNFPDPDILDQNTKSFIHHYVDEINYIRENDIHADENIAGSWAYFSTSDYKDLDIKNGKDVSPLIDPIAWNQDYPWNVLCPEDPSGPGGHVYVGCVATAMSQIMLYWRYPLQGQSSYSYYLPDYGTISANFGETHYNWDGMKCNMDKRNVYDMALIGFHAGVSVKMDYSPDGSGSQSSRVPGALKTYFKYASTTKFIKKEDYSPSYWESKMQSELNAGRPLYYSGYSSEGGHAFVCDGYQSDTPDNFYHFNFGWSGSGNGFFTLKDVGGYNNGQGMVYGIKPGDNQYPYIASGIDTLKRMAGSFTDGSGPIEPYPAGMNASWLISPQTETDSIVNIKFHFVKMKTGNNDQIKIYNGPTTSDPLVGSWSGSNMPADFVVDNNQVLITFSSSSSSDGFWIEYSTTGPTWCTGTEDITDPYGTVTDGSGDFYYNNGTVCSYYLHHPEAVKYNIEFTEFETEPDHDKLTFYTDGGALIDVFSGFDIPEPFSIEAKGLVLFWETNSSENHQGWSFDFTVDGVGMKESYYDDFNVYPNPAHGTLNINFSIEKANNVNVTLTNLSGQQVYKESLNTLNGKYQRSIDVSRLAKGVYLLSVTSNKGTTNSKVVIQ
jgi:hypothetical protein